MDRRIRCDVSVNFLPVEASIRENHGPLQRDLRSMAGPESEAHAIEVARVVEAGVAGEAFVFWILLRFGQRRDLQDNRRTAKFGDIKIGDARSIRGELDEELRRGTGARACPRATGAVEIKTEPCAREAENYS